MNINNTIKLANKFEKLTKKESELSELMEEFEKFKQNPPSDIQELYHLKNDLEEKISIYQAHKKHGINIDLQDFLTNQLNNLKLKIINNQLNKS